MFIYRVCRPKLVVTICINWLPIIINLSVILGSQYSLNLFLIFNKCKKTRQKKERNKIDLIWFDLIWYDRAFGFIICFVSCFCARHWLYTIFILHCASLWFYNLLCFLFSCKTLHWVCTTLYYIVSAFDFIFGSQMPFECTTHIRPPFLSVCPLHSAFCTCPILVEFGFDLLFVIDLRIRASYIWILCWPWAVNVDSETPLTGR